MSYDYLTSEDMFQNVIRPIQFAADGASAFRSIGDQCIFQ
jgi:hypothetical protein